MQNEKTGKGLSRVSTVFIAVLSVLTLILFVVTLMERLGYPCVYTGFTLYGGALLLVGLLAWGGYMLFRRIKTRAWRIVGGSLLFFVLLVAFLTLISFTGQYNALYRDTHFNTIDVDGKKIVILRRVDMNWMDEEEAGKSIARMQERQDAYNAAHPDEEWDGEYVYEAYGYAYTAYPRIALVFYNTKADVEGVVYRGAASQAELRYKTLEDGTICLYLDNPEVADSGEIYIK